MFNIVRNEEAEIAPELGDAMKQCRAALWTLFAFSVAINILVLATPIYMLQVLDRVLRSGHVETLIMLTIMASGAILIMSVLDMLRGAIAMRMGAWVYEALAPIFLSSSVRANLKGDDAGQGTLRDLGAIQSFVAEQGMSAFLRCSVGADLCRLDLDDASKPRNGRVHFRPRVVPVEPCQ